MLGGGGGVSHPLQLTTGLVIKSATTSPTLAGEHMLFILQAIFFCFGTVFPSGTFAFVALSSPCLGFGVSKSIIIK